MFDTLIPKVEELAYIPYTCWDEEDAWFCMRLNLHRLEHRNEKFIAGLSNAAIMIANYLNPLNMVHMIFHHIMHKIHHFRDSVTEWAGTFGSDIDTDGASWG